MAITRAPRSFAIWIAALETPLPAACTSTVSPGAHLRLVDEHLPGGEEDERDRGRVGERERLGEREEVRVGDVVEARVASLRALAEDFVALAEVVLPGEALRADAAREAGADEHLVAELEGPERRAPGPRASIVPAMSAPRRCGYSCLRCGRPRRVQMSRWFSATARTRTRTSRGPGSGRSIVSRAEDLGAAVGAEDHGFDLHGGEP